MTERFGILCIAPDWTSPPRTARQLCLQGAEVCIIAPPDSYAALTRFKTADVLMPAAEISRKMPSLARTLAEGFGAHSILAGDNAAFTFLAQLRLRMDGLGLSEATRAMLARSAPPPAVAPIVAQDSLFITSQGDGPCAPPAAVANPSTDAALAFALSAGFPVMVKRDGCAAGKGVTLSANELELRKTLSTIDGGFVVQRHVAGEVYGVAVVGVSGRAVAAFSFAKHEVSPAPHGPATVIRHDQRDDIIADAKRLFEAHGLNGFAGFDYIVDAAGRAHLIEVNPYIVEGHVGGVFGSDLTAAMLAAVRGETPAPGQAGEHTMVAMFPNEWQRDPASAYLASTHHDVPWDDPELVGAMLRDCMSARPDVNARLSA